MWGLKTSHGREGLAENVRLPSYRGRGLNLQLGHLNLLSSSRKCDYKKISMKNNSVCHKTQISVGLKNHFPKIGK